MLLKHSVSDEATRDGAWFPGAGRYQDWKWTWLPSPQMLTTRKGSVVYEVKWRKLSAADRRHIPSQLEQKWHRTALSQRHNKARRLAFDAMDVLKPSR